MLEMKNTTLQSKKKPSSAEVAKVYAYKNLGIFDLAAKNAKKSWNKTSVKHIDGNNRVTN